MTMGFGNQRHLSPLTCSCNVARFVQHGAVRCGASCEIIEGLYREGGRDMPSRELEKQKIRQGDACNVI